MNGEAASEGHGGADSHCPGGRKDNRLWVRSGQALPACLLAPAPPCLCLIMSGKAGTQGWPRGAGQLAEELGNLVCRYRCNRRLSLEAEVKAH